MPITKETPHRVDIHGCQLIYWQQGGACSVDEADRCVVSGPGNYPQIEFEYPAGKRNIEKIVALLGHAYAAGDHNARLDIRKALGVIT